MLLTKYPRLEKFRPKVCPGPPLGPVDLQSLRTMSQKRGSENA